MSSRNDKGTLTQRQCLGVNATFALLIGWSLFVVCSLAGCSRDLDLFEDFEQTNPEVFRLKCDTRAPCSADAPGKKQAVSSSEGGSNSLRYSSKPGWV